MNVCHSAVSCMHPEPLQWVTAGECKSKLEEHSVIIFKYSVMLFSAVKESQKKTSSGTKINIVAEMFTLLTYIHICILYI